MSQLQERQIILQAQLQANENSKLPCLRDLSDVEFSAYSQWGEDGIIDWLISQLPEIPKIFVEFGVENYREANTRLLLKLHNWQGLVIDGSERNIRDICSQDIYWQYDLTAKHAFIDRNNINVLLKDNKMLGNIGLLSIDIDGNDYWIWKEIDIISPAIVVIEYNAVFGDVHELTVPYRSDFYRTKAHYSNLYFGASLPALIKLGDHKGYQFIGTNSTGTNAFFVKKELMFRFEKLIKEFIGYNSVLRESRNINGALTFLANKDRRKVIKELDLINLKTDKIVTLGELSQVNTSLWDIQKKRTFHFD